VLTLIAPFPPAVRVLLRTRVDTSAEVVALRQSPTQTETAASTLKPNGPLTRAGTVGPNGEPAGLLAATLGPPRSRVRTKMHSLLFAGTLVERESHLSIETTEFASGTAGP
jgi:hypothetical protein